MSEAQNDLRERREAEVREAIDRVGRALSDYFSEYGAEHLEGCPQDDTCDCPLVVEISAALRELRGVKR